MGEGKSVKEHVLDSLMVIWKTPRCTTSQLRRATHQSDKKWRAIIDMLETKSLIEPRTKKYGEPLVITSKGEAVIASWQALNRIMESRE